MAAEGLPAGAPAAALPGGELEAWYQDLQEVLAAAEPAGTPLPWVPEQDAALAAELLELLGPQSGPGPEPPPPGAASGRGSPAQEAAAAAPRGVKRQRCGGAAASRERAKHRERASEQRVLELTAHNERLRAEIRRLSTEVQHTRAALIDRIVNLRRA
uniref:DNA damage-inducible transcript 3 protein n=1 Tax=Amazona collaria TaxID=241587 RepID=A0A8B9G814_9PSIT